MLVVNHLVTLEEPLLRAAPMEQTLGMVLGGPTMLPMVMMVVLVVPVVDTVHKELMQEEMEEMEK